MSAFCDRCQEHTNQILKIANLPEVAAVSHLGYREVCAPCYDDLVAEASEVEGQKEDRRDEPRVKVSLKALVEGNTSHLEAFSDEMNVVEISKSGLRLETAREIDLEVRRIIDESVTEVRELLRNRLAALTLQRRRCAEGSPSSASITPSSPCARDRARRA